MLTLQSTDKEVMSEIERLRVLYTLKHTMRYQSSRDRSVHSESVAEHLYGMAIIAQYFLPLEDPQRSMDHVRIHELILFHELGEIETGDISFHHKKDEHKARERIAAERVAARLPDSLSQLALGRCKEFEEGHTKEAKFAQAIDKLEPIFEMADPLGVPLFKQQNINRKTALGVKHATCKNYPFMFLFATAWETWMVSQNAFAE